MRIVNNTAAFNTWSAYTQNTSGMQSSMNHLATGVKNVADDPAGIGISERMRAQSSGTAMARNNVDNGISMIQTADAWLQKVNDMLNRMGELAIESNDGTKTSTDRDNVQTEFKQMQNEIVRITSGTMAAAKFNGQCLFGKKGDTDVTTNHKFTVQVGADQAQTIDINLEDLRSNSGVTFQPSGTTAAGGVEWKSIIGNAENGMVLGGMSIGSNVAAGSSQMTINIRNLAGAVDFVANTRASIGSQQKRFTQTRDALLSYEDNVRAAESKVRDVDMARESTTFAKYQILSQASNAMLAQANQLPQSVLQLLG